MFNPNAVPFKWRDIILLYFSILRLKERYRFYYPRGLQEKLLFYITVSNSTLDVSEAELV